MFILGFSLQKPIVFINQKKTFKMKKTILNLLTALLLVGTSLSLNAQFDRALSFDGVNDFVRRTPAAATDPELNLTTGTLEAWIKADGINDNEFHGVVVKQIAFGLFVYNGKLATYDWTTSSLYLSSATVGDGLWHHIAMSFQSGVNSGTILYVDGAPVLTATMTVLSNMHELTIGTGNTAGTMQFVHSIIDDVRIWNVVRTASEISTARNAEISTPLPASLVAYYKFNQSSGTVLTDATANANDCDLSNFALTGATSNWVPVNTPLPVELLSFKATPQYETVKLDWKATNNSLNKGFQIERLKVQTNEWEVLDFVAADAKSNAYTYVDNSYLADRNVNYYRLRQIDFDGTEFFSKVVSVSFNKGKSLKIYPSIVFDGVLNLEMTGKGVDTEGSSFAIVNMFGQQMQSGKMTGQAVNVSVLPNGTYIVKVGTEQAKFIKQ